MEVYILGSDPDIEDGELIAEYTDPSTRLLFTDVANIVHRLRASGINAATKFYDRHAVSGQFRVIYSEENRRSKHQLWHSDLQILEMRSCF
jgi:hypothetical protein